MQARNKTFMAWCEGMLAERIGKIACSCGLTQLEPFAEVNPLACDSCLQCQEASVPASSRQSRAGPSLHVRCASLVKQDVTCDNTCRFWKLLMQTCSCPCPSSCSLGMAAHRSCGRLIAPRLLLTLGQLHFKAASMRKPKERRQQNFQRPHCHTSLSVRCPLYRKGAISMCSPACL